MGARADEYSGCVVVLFGGAAGMPNVAEDFRGWGVLLEVNQMIDFLQEHSLGGLEQRFVARLRRSGQLYE